MGYYQVSIMTSESIDCVTSRMLLPYQTMPSKNYRILEKENFFQCFATTKVLIPDKGFQEFKFTFFQTEDNSHCVWLPYLFKSMQLNNSTNATMKWFVPVFQYLHCAFDRLDYERQAFSFSHETIGAQSHVITAAAIGSNGDTMSRNMPRVKVICPNRM